MRWANESRQGMAVWVLCTRAATPWRETLGRGYVRRARGDAECVSLRCISREVKTGLEKHERPRKADSSICDDPSRKQEVLTARITRKYFKVCPSRSRQATHDSDLDQDLGLSCCAFPNICASNDGNLTSPGLS